MAFAPFANEIYISCRFMAVSWSYGHVNELLEYIAHKRLLGSHSHSHSLLHIKTIYVMCSVLLCWCVVGASVAQLARCLYYYRRLIQASIIWFIIFPVSLVVYRLAYWLLVSEYNAKQCQLLQKYSTIRNGWEKKNNGKCTKASKRATKQPLFGG